MDNKIITVSIGLVISMVVLASVLVPVVDDLTNQSIAEYNNSMGVYAKAVENESIHVEYSFNDGAPIWEINGNVIAHEPPEILLLTDKNMLTNSSDSPKWIGEGYGRQDEVRTLDATINDNQLIGTLTTAARTFDLNIAFEWCIFATNDGPYRSIQVDSTDESVFIHSVNDLYFGNWIYGLSTWMVGKGETVTLGNNANYTVHTNFQSVDGVDGVLNGTLGVATDGYVIEVTKSDGTIETIHPYFYIVPAKVVGEKVAGGFAISSLIAALPVLVLAAILMFAISAIRLRD